MKDVSVEQMQKWLLKHSYAEEKSGYGHVSAEDLANALLAKFIISLPEDDD